MFSDAITSVQTYPCHCHMFRFGVEKKPPRQRVFSHNLLRPEIIMSWDMGTLLYIDDDDDDVVAAIQSNC